MQDAAARELQKEAEAKTRALALRDATQQQLESFKARLLSERYVMVADAQLESYALHAGNPAWLWQGTGEAGSPGAAAGNHGACC